MTINPLLLMGELVSRNRLPQGTFYLDVDPTRVPDRAGMLQLGTYPIQNITFLYCSVETSPGAFEWKPVKLPSRVENSEAGVLPWTGINTNPDVWVPITE